MVRASLGLVVFGLVLAGSAQAQLREPSTGATFAEQVTDGGTQFQCLGAGVRKVFVVKAYALTYCLERDAVGRVNDWVRANHDASASRADLTKALRSDGQFFYELARTPSDRMVVMRMTRDVSKKQLTDAFTESLENVLPAQATAKLVALVPGDAKNGETIVIRSKGSTLTFRIGDRENTVQDAEIATKLWDVWLSPDSVSPTLKQALAERFAGSASPRG